MKCPACNYERTWEDGEKKEDFICLDVAVTITKGYELHKVDLVACPKCNCVLLNQRQRLKSVI